MSLRCRIVVYTLLGLFLLSLLLAVGTLLHFGGTFCPILRLKGDHELIVQVHTTWKDPSVIARYHLKDHTDEIRIESDVDRHKLGTYTLTYYWDDYGKVIHRKVHVVDTEAPKLTLQGEKLVRMFVGEVYKESGYQAQDGYDGDVSDAVKIQQDIDTQKPGIYTITYQVQDHSGNSAKATRQVEVLADPTRSRLHYAYDSYDNTMEEWWFEKSKDHQRMDAAMAEDILTSYAACYRGADEKVLYLTFDEGGSDITYIKEIAAVLNQHKVTATFFLTRNYMRDEAGFIRDLVAHGHVIGNHTWHHYDMTTLANAQNVDRFVAEITETEKTYMQVTGEPMKKVFRFPKGGGSERALKMLADMGYRTYYWSHAYYDYGGDVSAQQALQTMLTHYHNGAIYLLHPHNKGNYEALDAFLNEMEDLGYRFDTVDHIKIGQ